MSSFGFLKLMNDTIRQNREMLGKKKSLREVYKEEIRKRGTNADKQNAEFVRQRVAAALKRNIVKEYFRKIIALFGVTGLIVGAGWIFLNVDSPSSPKAKYTDKSLLFTTIIYDDPNGLKLKTDFFVNGPKASETYLKNGLKHQNSESFYESGEQFRSALYYYDTLVKEVYFYKNGDTIKNFPSTGDDVLHIMLINKTISKKIEFDFYDGKIVGGTYKEVNLTP